MNKTQISLMTQIFALIYKPILIVIISFSLLGCKEENSSPYSFEIKHLRDSIDGENKLLIVSSNLTNNSNDTLRFITMSCMWSIIYSVDNPKIHLKHPEVCFKNIPVEIIIPPKEEYYKTIVLIGSNMKEEFKIGISFIKIDNLRNFPGLEIFDEVKKGNKECEQIWSNSISN